MSSDHGPGYYDVDRYVEVLRNTYGIGIHLVLVSPLYIAASGRKTSWCVSVQAWQLPGAVGLPFGGQASFGQGGAWKTFPAAAHAALREFEAKLVERERSAAKQAAF